MRLKSFNLVVLAVLSSLVASLDLFGIVAFPTGILSVSGFYIGSAFYVLIIAHFRALGALGVYLGLVLASVFTGFSLFPLYGALGNTLASVFVVVGARFLRIDFSFMSIKDYLFVALLYLLAPCISALWVISGWVYVGILPRESFVPALSSWWFGGVLVYLFVATPLLKYCLPLLSRFKIKD